MNDNQPPAKDAQPRGVSAARKTTIARIRNAARKVFTAKGFFPASVEEIAESAGVSRATVYLYYRSKDEMLVDLMRQDLEYQLEIYAELVTLRRLTIAGVRKWLERLRGEQEDRRASLNLFWAGVSIHADAMDPVARHRDNVIATLGRRFAGFDIPALPRGEREARRIRCYMMLFMIEGVTVQLVDGAPGPATKPALDQLARTLMQFLESGEIATS